MRAATVRINDVSGVAGFVQPNDSVDVLITRQVQRRDDVGTGHRRPAAERPRHRDRPGRKNSDGTPKVARTATLEVDPLDAQKLALGQQVGSLSLVLRKPGEQNNPVVETVSLNDLRYNMYGGARYPAPAVVGGFGGAVAGAMSAAPRWSRRLRSRPRRRSSRRLEAGAKPRRRPSRADRSLSRDKSDQV